MEKVKDAPLDSPVGLLAPPAGAWSTPSTIPPTPAFTTLDPTALLDALVDDVDGVHGAVLASVDGFGIARSSSMADEPSHPAMLAAAVGLAHQLASMGGGEHLRQLVVDHDAGLMLVWPVGRLRVLAVLAATTVEQRRVRTFVHAQAPALARAGGGS
jgi:hypothetical protein